MESKPWTICWFTQGQKKEHLNWMWDIKFRESSADTEQIKYNTNRIKAWSSKNINLLKVKRKQSWIQGSNKIQQHFCWCSLNYKCAKGKLLQPDMRNKFFRKSTKFLVRALHMNHGGFQCQIWRLWVNSWCKQKAKINLLE